MRGVSFLFLLLCLFPFSAAFAIGERVAAVAAAATRVESKAPYVAAASNQPPGKAPTGAKAQQPKTGYIDLVGGLGMAQIFTGKSFIGISNAEQDWVSQTNFNHFQSVIGNIGLGYVHFLSNSERYFETFSWFPSVETILNLYFADLTAKGHVFLFNNPNFPTSTFEMPIRTTNLMIDVIVNIISYQHFTWYVLGGIGEAWTRVSYSDAPDSIGAPSRPALDLRDRTQSHSTYEWGTGISYAVNCNLRVVFAYLYTHIGNFKTSENGTLDGVNTVLVSPAAFSLRTQALMLQLQYGLT